MQQELIITKNDLSVVDATPGCRYLLQEDVLKTKRNLLEYIPALKNILHPQILRGGGVLEGVTLETGIYSVRVFPAKKHITFIFRLSDGFSSDTAGLSELLELKKRNVFLETIIEEAPIGLILCNEQGTILYVNKKQELNSRQKRRQLIGRDIREVYQKAFEYSEITQLFDRVVNSTVSSETLIVDHYYPQFYKKDMIIKFIANRLKEHERVTVFVEIEDELYREKRKAEKAGEDLRMSQNYMAQLLDSSPNMVISIDNKRRVVSFNKTAEHLLGFKASEVYNSPVDRFFPKEELLKLELAVSSQDLWYGTVHIYRSDKSSFPIELYTNKVKDEKTGKDIATLFLAVDIEERNKLRLDLIQSQKMNFIGELVNGLAHQINNPLVGVINIADVLLQMINIEDERYAYVKMIREAGESCKEVISRLLRFSRRQEGVTHAEIDLRNVLDAGIEMLMKHPDFKKVRVERRYKDVSTVRGDPVLLQQAFMNMLINSAQALQCDGVIKVGCGYDNTRGTQVIVTIRDSGCGIPEEDIPKVFEPFFSTKNVDDGTGIGLSLAYWIIQEHGGRISVESVVGKGSTFTTYLPFKG
ncbi:MAG: ATP-binding protein [Smithella sp.]|jgi:PAS domain S-box-containing protein